MTVLRSVRHGTPVADFQAFPSGSLREACAQTLPRVATAEEFDELVAGWLYLPASHAKALDPAAVLVSGIRGSGKTYWWQALARPNLLELIAEEFPRYNLARYEVKHVYGPSVGRVPWPARPIMDGLSEHFSGETIWRAVLLWVLESKGLPALSRWADRCAWIHSNPEDAVDLLDELDDERAARGRPVLALFDALDTTASSWDGIYKLLGGLLRVLGDLRLRKGIRAKAFVREDMMKVPATSMGFADASKVLATAVTLDWSARDLYGLLFQRLANAPDNAGVGFREGITELTGLSLTRRHDVWVLPRELRVDERAQRTVLHAITGPWMGNNRRRGIVYSWVPRHLSDAYEKVSPRSLLAAFRAASEHAADAPGFPIPWRSLREGVRRASQVRVDELRKEEYPWVERVFEPLRGLEVPMDQSVVLARWQRGQTLDSLTQMERNRPRRLQEGPPAVIEELIQLGILSRTGDGRLQMPDLYRVAFGLRRKGGVPPVT